MCQKACLEAFGTYSYFAIMNSAALGLNSAEWFGFTLMLENTQLSEQIYSWLCKESDPFYPLNDIFSSRAIILIRSLGNLRLHRIYFICLRAEKD